MTENEWRNIEKEKLRLCDELQAELVNAQREVKNIRERLKRAQKDALKHAATFGGIVKLG
jgi:hypothetical protein